MQIEIPSDCEKINILFSGGMDSSILLYLLLKQIETSKKDITVTCYSFGESSERKSVQDVLTYMRDRFLTTINVKKRGTKYKIRELVELILSTEGGYVFSGCNKVVEDKFTPTVYIPNDTPPWRGPSFNENHIRPFIDIDKIEILKIYIQENILDLLPLTNSCGIQGKTKCGGCYFCMERQWAMDSLYISDL